MFRILRLNTRNSMARFSAYFSERPSTSRASDFAEPIEEGNSNKDLLKKLPPNSLRKTDQEITEDCSDNSLEETKKRIHRWKQKTNLVMKEPNNGILNSKQLQELVDNEENHYHERAVEIVRNLSDKSYLPVKESMPTMLSEDEEIKRKTGKVKFRSIIYNEGELNKSDLLKPPSRENPHPFNPETCTPPIYSRTIAPFVNKMPVLQTLVDLGVNLFEIDTTTNCGKFLLRLDQEKDIKPKLQWLVSLGCEPADLGDYITRNPFFLVQDLHDMQNRVNYLEMMKFPPEQIKKIIQDFRYWINTDVKTMDSRLGWMQKQFELKGSDVRTVISKEPRVLMFGLGPLKRIFDFFNKECLFTMSEIKYILKNDPRVFMMDPRYIQNNYFFVSKVLRLSNSAITKTPFLLRCSLSSLKNRHEFLRKLGRAHYEGQQEETPSREEPQSEAVDHVLMVDLLHPSDAHFAKRAGKSYLVVYDKFLRSH